MFVEFTMEAVGLIFHRSGVYISPRGPLVLNGGSNANKKSPDSVTPATFGSLLFIFMLSSI